MGDTKCQRVPKLVGLLPWILRGPCRENLSSQAVLVALKRRGAGEEAFESYGAQEASHADPCRFFHLEQVHKSNTNQIPLSSSPYIFMVLP